MPGYIFLNSNLVAFKGPTDIAGLFRSEGEKSLLTCTVMLAKSPCMNKTFHVYEFIAEPRWDWGIFFSFPDDQQSKNLPSVSNSVGMIFGHA